MSNTKLVGLALMRAATLAGVWTGIRALFGYDDLLLVGYWVFGACAVGYWKGVKDA